MTEIKISLTPMGTGRIELDGHEVQNAVAGLTINANAGDPTSMLVRLSGVALSYIGQVDVRLPDSTHQLLVAAGWTPPGETFKAEPHRHRASCHGSIGELQCGEVEV